MADQNLNVGITSKFDPGGFDQASEAAKKTSKDVEGIKGAAATAQEGVEKLSEKLAELASFAELISFLKDSTEEFYQNEKAIRGVTTAAAAFGADVPKVKKQVEEWSEAMSHLSGVSDNELTRAVGQQYTLTGSLEQAYKRVAIATDIVSSSDKNFGQAMEIVEAAIHGRTRALVGVIPGVQKDTEATEAQSLALKYFETVTKNATLTVNDHAKAADQARARWEMFKEQIGSQIAPAITFLKNSLVSVVDAVALLASEFGAWTVKSAEKIGAFATFIKEIFTTSLGSAWQHFRDTSARADQEYYDTLEALEESALHRQEQREQQGVNAHKDAHKTKLELDHLRQAEERKEYTLWVSDTRAFLKEWEKYQKNRAKMAKETDDDILFHYVGMTQKELEIQGQTEAMSARILKQALEKKKAAARAELEIAEAVASGVIGFATAAFGQTKDIQAAQAIISGLLGYMKAIEQLGPIFGPIVGILAIAAGIATAIKIESTEPAAGGASTSGAGFDDPSNDAAARQGGRRWAADMIREWSQGVSAGWSEGMRGGQTVTNNYDQSRRTTINANIQDPRNVETVKQLVRTIRMVDQNVLGQTTIAGRTR